MEIAAGLETVEQAGIQKPHPSHDSLMCGRPSIRSIAFCGQADAHIRHSDPVSDAQYEE